MLYYPTDSILGFTSCSYDDHGDLYIAGGDSFHIGSLDLVRISSGSSSFESISVSTKLYGAGSLQWQGKRLMVGSWPGQGTPITVYGLRISATTAKATETSQLDASKDKFTGQMLLDAHKAVTADYYRHGAEQITLWAYPKGGMPERNVRQFGKGKSGDQLWGEAISPGN